MDDPEREGGRGDLGRKEFIAMEHQVKQVSEDGKEKLLLPLWGLSEVAEDKDAMGGGCDPHGCVPCTQPGLAAAG